jgi:Putative zinc-finger
MTCDHVRDQLAELALGIADGEERARVLEHVAVCLDCQRELERLSEVADRLLELAPDAEPPAGFELRVLETIHPRPVRRPRLGRWVLAVAAAILAAAVATGSLLYATRDDRRLADHYRATLTQANGSYFGAARLRDGAGREAGAVFVYRGAPSWVTVTVDRNHAAEARRVELIDTAGKSIPLGWASFSDGAWGGALPVDLDRVATVRVLAADGHEICSVAMPRTRA